MIKFTLELLSIWQILLGFNYHSGTEVFDPIENDGEELKMDFHEVQIGLIFIIVQVTYYTLHKGEE